MFPSRARFCSKSSSSEKTNVTSNEKVETINLLSQLGEQTAEKIKAAKSSQKISLLSFYDDKTKSPTKITSKKEAFQMIEVLFKCSRVVVGMEPDTENPDQKLVYHMLFELSPAMTWRAVCARFSNKSEVFGFNLIPLNSFTRGWKFVLGVDQEPFFWNFEKEKAKP